MPKITTNKAGTRIMAKFFDAVNHNINEVDKHMWDCYGPNAFMIDAELKSPNKQPCGLFDDRTFIASAQIIIDAITHTVYEVTLCDYVYNDGQGRGYMWCNPATQRRHENEARERGHDPYKAWDDVRYKLVRINDVLSRIKTMFAAKPKKKKTTKTSTVGKLAKPVKRKKVASRRR